MDLLAQHNNWQEVLDKYHTRHQPAKTPNTATLAQDLNYPNKDRQGLSHAADVQKPPPFTPTINMTQVNPEWDIKGTGKYCLQDHQGQYTIHDPEGHTIAHISASRMSLLEASYSGNDLGKYLHKLLCRYKDGYKYTAHKKVNIRNQWCHTTTITSLPSVDRWPSSRKRIYRYININKHNGPETHPTLPKRLHNVNFPTWMST